MAASDRIAKWDARYARHEETHGFAPSPLLAQAIEGVAPGLALDVACGAGRHAVALAERGWRVVAVDGSCAGVDLLRTEARRRGVADRIDARVADLSGNPTSPRGFAIERARYDLVACFFFLDRSLFPEMRAGVRPGGLFVAAIHVNVPGDAAPHRFLLDRGELRRIVEPWRWEILHAREGVPPDSGHTHPAAEIVARQPGAQARPLTTVSASNGAETEVGARRQE